MTYHSKIPLLKKRVPA